LTTYFCNINPFFKVWIHNRTPRRDNCHIVTPETAELKDELPSTSISMEIADIPQSLYKIQEEESYIKDKKVSKDNIKTFNNIIEEESKQKNEKNKGTKPEQNTIPTSGCIIC
jgi:hypothetical protein